MTQTKRPTGAGNIEPLPSGKTRVRVRLADGQRVSLGVFDSEAKAREVLDAFLIQAASASMTPVGTITLRTLGRRFLDHRELRGIRGIKIERYRWRFHVESAFFADWPLVDVTPRDIRRWRDELASKRATAPASGGTKLAPKRLPTSRRLSRTTIKNALNLLRGCFHFAVEEDLLASNPAVGVRVERDVRTEDPWTFLDPAEQEAIFTLPTMNVSDRELVRFAVGTGLRRGELAALRLVDVRTEGEHPEVVVRFGSPGKPTKSGRIRVVPLFGIGLDAAKKWIASLPAYAKENPLGLFAPTRFGNCRYLRQLRTRIDGRPATWADVVRAAGIRRRIRWHDLRHTCASSLIAGWWGRRWSMEEVKEMLGHTSIVVTQRYAHLAQSALRQAALETTMPGPRLVHD